MQSIISQLITNPDGVVGYLWEQGKLKYNGKLVVRNYVELRLKIIGEFQESAIGGLAGILLLGLVSFYWSFLRKDMVQSINRFSEISA